MKSEPLLESQMQLSGQIIRSISFVSLSPVVPSNPFSSAQNPPIESRFAKSQIIPQTNVKSSDRPMSHKALGSKILDQSLRQLSDQIHPSLCVLPSLNSSPSSDGRSQPALPISAILVKTKELRSSLNPTFPLSFNQNTERGSLQWFSSNRIKVSVFPLFQSQNPETTAPFLSIHLSHPFQISHRFSFKHSIS
jgi:hypothetical protein